MSSRKRVSTQQQFSICNKALLSKGSDCTCTWQISNNIEINCRCYSSGLLKACDDCEHWKENPGLAIPTTSLQLPKRDLPARLPNLSEGIAGLFRCLLRHLPGNDLQIERRKEPPSFKWGSAAQKPKQSCFVIFLRCKPGLFSWQCTASSFAEVTVPTGWAIPGMVCCAMPAWRSACNQLLSAGDCRGVREGHPKFQLAERFKKLDLPRPKPEQILTYVANAFHISTFLGHQIHPLLAQAATP